MPLKAYGRIELSQCVHARTPARVCLRAHTHVHMHACVITFLKFLKFSSHDRSMFNLFEGKPRDTRKEVKEVNI